MKTQPDFAGDFVIEPERYELHAAPVYNFNVTRRRFFKLLGGGVVIVALVHSVAAQESGRRGGGRGGGNRPREISAWLHIAEDGTITAFTGKAEVGQNIRTTLTQIIAEELRVPVSAIRLVMADTALVPYDAGTFSSRSTPDMVPQLRRVAAAARESLIDLAAEQQKAERDVFTIAGAKIKNTKTGETFGFGQITKGQKFMKTVADNPPMTNHTQWKITGTSVPKVDGGDFVSGKHQFATDVKLPGMLHGKIVRRPVQGAKLVSLDGKGAEALPGVKVIHDGEFAGVVAPDTLQAERAVKALRAEWSGGSSASDVQLFDQLKRGAKLTTEAKPEPGENGAQKLSATYTIAYIAHAPLEPRAAVAEWKDGKLTVWTGTQRAFGVKAELMQAFGLADDKVRVIDRKSVV